MNPPAYNPNYHFELAIESGCSAYAAPLGFLGAAAGRHAGEIPLFLKLNNHDSLHNEKDPISAVTGSVCDALRLGCAAIGVTIYPGLAHARDVLGLARIGGRGQITRYSRGGLILSAWFGAEQGG